MPRNEFLSRTASSVLKVNCYQRGSCVGGPSTFNFPFGHGSRSHNILPLDNRLPLPFELTTSRSGGERSTITLPVGSTSRRRFEHLVRFFLIAFYRWSMSFYEEHHLYKEYEVKSLSKYKELLRIWVWEEKGSNSLEMYVLEKRGTYY